jgi:hypothetical protein
MSTRPPNYTPRAPTDDELKELSVWNVKQGLDEDDAEHVARCAYVAVFDQYESGSPGYVGKVMTVVWDGSPSTFNVFTWNKGRMEEAVH